MISVIVCTYNPELFKLERTLYSIAIQKNVEFEIIITDDGSVNNFKQQIKNFFLKLNFHQYLFIEHGTNNGTVKNIIDGVQHANGKYIYLISPGDILYDDHVLSDFYIFSEKNGIDFCFGQTVYYRNQDEKIYLYPSELPKVENIYKKNIYNQLISKIAFFSGQQPVGASYFRKKDKMLLYLKQIEGKVKYVEDFPMSAMYLLENNKLYLLKRPVVFYEYGSGISTSKNEVWNNKLNMDFSATKNILTEKYRGDKIIETKYILKKGKRFRYPLICVIGAIIKIYSVLSPNRIKNEKEKRKILNEIFEKVDFAHERGV